MKYITYFALSVFLLCSCEREKNEKPNALIAHNKFVDVLTDIRLLEGAYSTKVSRPDTIKEKMEGYYLLLFQKHQISKEQFISSYQYYLKQKEEMLSIEDEVMEKLKQMNMETASADSLSKYSPPTTTK